MLAERIINPIFFVGSGVRLMSIFQEIIVAYDVSLNSRRNQLYQKLLDLGLVAIQKSVFWGRITKAEQSLILRLLNQYLDPKTDKAFSIRADLSENILRHSVGYQDKKNIFENRNYEVI